MPEHLLEIPENILEKIIEFDSLEKWEHWNTSVFHYLTNVERKSSFLQNVFKFVYLIFGYLTQISTLHAVRPKHIKLRRYIYVMSTHLESFGTKSLDVRNTFFRHCLVNTW